MMNKKTIYAEDKTRPTDFFSIRLAFRHGIPSALVLGRVALFCRDFQNFGEPCLCITQANLARTFPYLRQEAVIKVIHKLTAKGLLLNKPRKRRRRHPNKARWSYCVSKEVWKQARTDLQYFKIADAVLYGYREAILLSVLEQKIQETRAYDPATVAVEMSPTALSKSIPIGISAISQKLKKLAKKGVIVRVDQTGKSALYGLGAKLSFDRVFASSSPTTAPAAKIEPPR